MILEKVSLSRKIDQQLSPSNTELKREQVVEEAKHPYKGRLFNKRA